MKANAIRYAPGVAFDRRGKPVRPAGFSVVAPADVEGFRAPQAMRLRYLDTLSDIANERSATIVFPFPIDLMLELGSRLQAVPKRTGS